MNNAEAKSILSNQLKAFAARPYDGTAYSNKLA
jgi:hypothetical protein